jgi:hypothetical protein
MQQIEQWRCAELTVISETAPHTVACGIYAEFTAPSGRIFVRDAFWNGENLFLVRYLLPETGIWQYRLSTGETGELTCVPYQGNLDLYRHGFLKVGPRGRYLCYADGTPFFWLGDTHWHFAIEERWNESNDPRFSSEFRAIVDHRVQQHFTVYQCNFHCEVAPQPGTKDRYFIHQGGTWIPDLTFLKDDLDCKMAYLADHGLCIAAGFSWFFSAFMPGATEYYRMAARYLVARYGAYPMIWTLAGEVGGYSASLRGQSIDFWREIAHIVEKHDTYHQLQTAHYTNERPFADYYQDEPWFDFTMNQAGHGDYPIDCRPYRAHRAAHPAKPFVESESMYEHILTLEPNGRRRATPAMLRRVAYLAMQNGACGYTYGAQGMWHIQWETPKEAESALGFGSFDPWYQAIDFPGADQMTILRSFYERVKWYRLSPLPQGCLAQKPGGDVVLTLDGDDLQALFMPSIMADENMTTVVAYYTETSRYKVGFRTLSQPDYKAFWFDPATGRETLIDAHATPQDGIWFAPSKAVEGDALLVLQA